MNVEACGDSRVSFPIHGSIIQNSLLYLIAVTATVGAWQYNFKLRLIAHDLFAFVFVCMFLLGILLKQNLYVSVRPEIKTFLWLYAGFFCVKLFSGIGLLQYGLRTDSYLDTALLQFCKGIGKEFLMLLMFYCVALYMACSSLEYCRQIVLLFIFGIVLSCGYQLISLAAIKFYDVELDRLIWPTISYNLQTERFLKAQIYGISGMVMFRAGGFSINPNSLASVLACAIPFCILYSLTIRKSFMVFVVLMLVSLFFTVSRSGMLATFIALLLTALFHLRRFLKSFKIPLLMSSLLMVVLSVYYIEQIALILESRVDPNNGSGFTLGTRTPLIDAALRIFSDYPLLGVGYGGAMVQLNHFPEIIALTGPDFHNFWLIKLIELGLVGFTYYLILHVYILYAMWKIKNIYGKTLLYALSGLSVSGFFNNVLASFELQFFILIFFCVAYIEDSRNLEFNSSINKNAIASRE